MEELNETNFFKDLFKSKEQKGAEANKKTAMEKYNAFTEEEKQKDFYNSITIIRRNLTKVLSTPIVDEIELDETGKKWLVKLTAGYYIYNWQKFKDKNIKSDDYDDDSQYERERDKQIKSMLKGYENTIFYIQEYEQTHEKYFTFVLVRSDFSIIEVKLYKLNHYVLNHFRDILDISDTNPFHTVIYEGKYYYGEPSDLYKSFGNNFVNVIQHEIERKRREAHDDNRFIKAWGGSKAKKYINANNLAKVKQVLGDTGWLKLFLSYLHSNHVIDDEYATLDELDTWLTNLSYNVFKKISPTLGIEQGLFYSVILPKP